VKIVLVGPPLLRAQTSYLFAAITKYILGLYVSAASFVNRRMSRAMSLQLPPVMAICVQVRPFHWGSDMMHTYLPF
jgi:hypothetical protein